MRKNTLLSLTTLAVMSVAPVAGGCTFDEELLIHNFQGTVVLPVEAGTRTLVRSNEDGSTYEEVITDPRFIGPVYLGLFPSVLPPDTIAEYAHPEIGPQYQDGIQGDTYPYGGTTIGDIKYACFEFLTCKFVTGRYATYDDMIQWFADVIGTPILDAKDAPIEVGEMIQQTCFDLLEVTSDKEIGLVTGDRNGDGKADAQDLDFVLSADGKFFEAEFTIWQQEFFWDLDQEDCEPGKDCTGFSLWAFMDAPDRLTSTFSTCDPTAGYQEVNYNQDFYGGKTYRNILNQPARYITPGDWVSNEAYVWNDIYAQPRLVIDFEVKP